MQLTIEDLRKVAHLARLSVSDQELERFQIAGILDFVSQIKNIDTDQVAPMAHPIPGMHQRLRTDVVSTTNERDAFQAIAPAVDAGLYLVPQVIDSE